MSYRLGGRNTLAYLGVEPATPSNTVVIDRPPTPTDVQNFNIGTYWIVPQIGTAPHVTSSAQLWVLLNAFKNVATWVQLYPSNAGGASQFIADDGGVANDLAGVINVFGGADGAGYININTKASGNTVEILLNDIIQWPNANPTITQGAIYLGGFPFLHNQGTFATFLGSQAGPTVNATNGSTGIGEQALSSLAANADQNTALGAGAGAFLVSGDKNLLLGYGAGQNYVGAETKNILLNHPGLAAENNTTRIGNSTDTFNAYMSGVRSATINQASAFMVLMDNTEKLGASQITSTDGSIAITKGPGTIDFSTMGTASTGESFMAVVDPFEPLTGLGTLNGTFFVGAQAVMNILYDNFGTLTPGDGAGTAATFMVPRDGFYSFTAGFIIGQTSNGGKLNGIINVNGAQYLRMEMPNTQAIPLRTAAVLVTGYAQLNAGDLVTFSAEISVNVLNPPAGFVGVRVPGQPFETFISGMLLRTF